MRNLTKSRSEFYRIIILNPSYKTHAAMKDSGTQGAIQHDGTVKKVDANSVLVSITSVRHARDVMPKECVVFQEKRKR